MWTRIDGMVLASLSPPRRAIPFLLVTIGPGIGIPNTSSSADDMPDANVESILQSLNDANELLAVHAALLLRVRSAQKQHRQQLHALYSPPTELLRLPLIPSRSPSPASSAEDSTPSSPRPESRQDLPPAKRARVARYHNYVPEEETIRNDYSHRYVDGGEWPQNWVLGAEPEHRFEE